ncbi:MAG: hypothetical protein KC457_20385, partial [Myxococcales bacterium]|nr:hypothetical protein [Myxococcales bacterium]
MLPLLDVFMVVLFVFATIQESQLDATTSERDSAAAELSAAEAALELAEDEAEAQGARADAAETRRQALAEEIEAYERACGPTRPGGPRCPAAAQGDARE